MAHTADLFHDNLDLIILALVIVGSVLVFYFTH